MRRESEELTVRITFRPKAYAVWREGTLVGVIRVERDGKFKFVSVSRRFSHTGSWEEVTWWAWDLYPGAVINGIVESSIHND